MRSGFGWIARNSAEVHRQEEGTACERMGMYEPARTPWASFTNRAVSRARPDNGVGHKAYVWMDGRLVAEENASVHVLSHTLHYGLGVFEGIRFYSTPNGPAVFMLEQHVERMFDGAKAAYMALKYTQEEVCQAIIDTIRANGIAEGYVRPIMFYGRGNLALQTKGLPVHCCVAVWPWGLYLGGEGVRVRTSPYMRVHPSTTRADAKLCGNYVNGIFASMEAKAAGFDEALLLDYRGNVAEGSGQNVFIAKDGYLSTPSLGNILPGITRQCVIEVAREMGYSVAEKELTIEEMKGADEAFFTGTATEVCPISQLDETKYGEPAIARRIQERFSRIVRGEEPRYKGWLTYVGGE